MVAASGSALPGDLGVEWMDRFGDNLYNTYGSTEVAYATIADPKDLREAPGTAGRTPHATEVRIYDENDEPVKQGETGRIFVGNGILFEGYTGGGHKDMIDGLMSSGDVGYLDEDGRLFVEGRDDDMIVSGGENVFPNEVEDCLTRHEAVHEAACIGVDDDDYGKRLKAFVALADGKDVSEDDLKAHVKSNLARYKVPREIVFMDELPRNATGKLLKRELEENGEDATSEADAERATRTARATRRSGSDDVGGERRVVTAAERPAAGRLAGPGLRAARPARRHGVAGRAAGPGRSCWSSSRSPSAGSAAASSRRSTGRCPTSRVPTRRSWRSAATRCTRSGRTPTRPGSAYGCCRTSGPTGPSPRRTASSTR